MLEVMGLAWSGVPKRFKRFIYMSWHRDVQYACIVVPFQWDVTVETSIKILCDLIFSWSAFMRLIVSYFLLYFMPKLSTIRANLIPFLLWRHNSGVIGAGSYPNGRICSLSAVCDILPSPP